MSRIIINIRNPALKFKLCSVFSANNPTVNDASGVTMLSVRSSRGGDDFLVCRQNKNRALHVSFPLIFFQLMEIRRSDRKH